MRSRFVLLFAALAIFAGACGGGADDGQAGGNETSPPEAAETTETAAPEAETEDTGTETAAETAADGQATVAVASSDLGDILVDGEGMTLYAFVPDDQGTPTCTEGCAETWPPLAGPGTAGEDVEGSLLGTVDHPAGMTMVTYDDWPLYHYAQDEQPGDVNGQGVGDSWYVVGPDGQLLMDAG